MQKWSKQAVTYSMVMNEKKVALVNYITKQTYRHDPKIMKSK